MAECTRTYGFRRRRTRGGIARRPEDNQRNDKDEQSGSDHDGFKFSHANVFSSRCVQYANRTGSFQDRKRPSCIASDE